MSHPEFFDFRHENPVAVGPEMVVRLELAVGSPAGNDYPLRLQFPQLEHPLRAEVWLEQGSRGSLGDRNVLLHREGIYFRSIKLRKGSVDFDLCVKPSYAKNWIWRQRLPVLHPSIIDLQLRSLQVGNTTANGTATALGGYNVVNITENRSETTRILELGLPSTPLKFRIGNAWRPHCTRRDRSVAELQWIHGNERWSLYGGDRLVLGRNACLPQRQDANDFSYRSAEVNSEKHSIGRSHGELRISNNCFEYRHVQNGNSRSERCTAFWINNRIGTYDKRQDEERSPLPLDTLRTSFLQPGEVSWNPDLPHMAVRSWYEAQIGQQYSYCGSGGGSSIEFAEPDSLGGFVVQMVHPVPAVHRRHVLIKSTLIVGRNTELCPISFPHADPTQVMDRHARVLWIDGGLWIEPFDRTCKIDVDGVRLHTNCLSPLTDQTTLRFGNNHIISCASIYQFQ